MLLVLNSAQLLVPPPTSGDDTRTDLQREIWDKSHLRIGKILPGFLEDFVAQPVPTSASVLPPASVEEERKAAEAGAEPVAGEENISVAKSQA